MAVTRYGLLDLLRQRADQPGFHIASEDGVRIELMRFQEGQTLGPLSCDGELVLTCLDGTFDIGDGTPVPPMTQVVVPRGENFTLECTSDGGAVQLIWAPPFAPARTG